MTVRPRCISGWWRGTCWAGDKGDEMKSQYGEVRAALDGHVALVEIDRPPNNHVSVELMRDLADALHDLDGETACRAVVLASAGKVFCGGADLPSPTGVGGS